MTPRKALDVCDAVIAAVPETEKEFTAALNSVRQSIAFRPPEMEQLNFEQLQECFNIYIFQDWQRDAIEAFTTVRPK